jgi:glyoxylase-like metal-dependent hydrolase (beta-lactamase superfamily II)
MEGEIPYPRRKKAVASVPKHLTEAIPMHENGQLHSFNGLVPYFTPGHSPGHVVYYHEKDGVLLAGDLFTSKKGQLKKPMPMFTADMNEAIKSSDIVKKLNPKHLEVCHGEPVFHPADQIEAYQKENTPILV